MKAAAITMICMMVLIMSIDHSDAGTIPSFTHRGRISPDMANVLPEGKVSLIVQFRDGPLYEDREFLEGLGFTIRRTFEAVPAISIDGAHHLIDRVLDNDRVTYVENNDPVVHDMEMGTSVINATQVWASLVQEMGGTSEPMDGTGVTVCVVDTGIDAGHPDLDHGTKTIKNLYDAGNGVWIEAENTDVNYGHGTHVAGTVAGNGDASAGARSGVAPGANLIGLTVSIPEQATTPLEDGYIQGLEWAYENSRPGMNPYNIRVVTNSWHVTVVEYDPSALLTQMIEKLTFENNVITTWSAGNRGREDPEGTRQTTSGQGNTPVAIMVAAYERDGSAVTDFSSRGKIGSNHTYPDVGAPGRAIWSASARRTVISGGSYTGGNTNPYYLAISGTSMSTPHVAGLAALLWQAAPSLKISDMHEDYSGPDPDWWYSNPNTRIHEIEWILEASALYLPPTIENGNLAGDTNSTGWGGKPIDYVQGYGIVDARRAVGIALTLERLRGMSRSMTVMDAIEVYDGKEVSYTREFTSNKALVSWSGEYSRYNDQSMNPLSLVNQTKYVEVPPGATSASVTMQYSGIDLTMFQAADIAFTIDTNGDGEPDHQSTLSLLDGSPDRLEVPVGSGDIWTFGIVGRGLKVPRPTQGTNYIELRVEYDISVVFTIEGEEAYRARPLNSVYAPVFPGIDSDEGAVIETFVYDMTRVELPDRDVPSPEPGRGFPWSIFILILAVAILATILYLRKKKKAKAS
ncbi:MAG: S8 family serine peptidase [Candidatus Thermoplasmatota archaeon]|nr:S8 family serine peptidase [Candidatus Thermoplasmatota archaeon]